MSRPTPRRAHDDADDRDRYRDDDSDLRTFDGEEDDEDWDTGETDTTVRCRVSGPPPAEVAWQPAANVGMQVGVGLLALLVVLALLGGWQVSVRDGGARLAALLLVLVAGAGAVAVGVLLRGLQQLRYWLREDVLEVSWLGRTERIPWLGVQDAEWQGEIRTGRPARAATCARARGGWEPWWPGYTVRHQERDGQRHVVLATMPVGRRVVLLHATGTLVISPERPVRFLSEVALRVAHALEREAASVDAASHAGSSASLLAPPRLPAAAPSNPAAERPRRAVRADAPLSMPPAPPAPPTPPTQIAPPVTPPAPPAPPAAPAPRVTPTLTATPRHGHQSAADGPGTASMPPRPIDVVYVDDERDASSPPPAPPPASVPERPARVATPERLDDWQHSRPFTPVAMPGVAREVQPRPDVDHEPSESPDGVAVRTRDEVRDDAPGSGVLHGFTVLGQERTGSVLLSVLGGLPILMGMVLYSRLDVLPDRIPLHWDADNQPDRFGTERALWLLPISAIVVAAISIIAASWAVARDRVTTLIVLWSAVLVQIALAIAVLRLTG